MRGQEIGNRVFGHVEVLRIGILASRLGEALAMLRAVCERRAERPSALLADPFERMKRSSQMSSTSLVRLASSATALRSVAMASACCVSRSSMFACGLGKVGFLSFEPSGTRGHAVIGLGSEGGMGLTATAAGAAAAAAVTAATLAWWYGPRSRSGGISFAGGLGCGRRRLHLRTPSPTGFTFGTPSPQPPSPATSTPAKAHTLHTAS